LHFWRTSLFALFRTKVINVGVRDSTYVLNGLLHHESDLRIEEHHTDTAAFTDHVFGLMPLVGFRFAPRIRDLGETKLFIPLGDAVYEGLKPMISSERLKISRTPATRLPGRCFSTGWAKSATAALSSSATAPVA
jgi:TnpA family transposase